MKVSMLLRAPFFSICSMLLSVSLLLTGCGGGGGGTSSGGGLAYNGLTDPAQITILNAETLATSALDGGSFSNAGALKSQSTHSAAVHGRGGTFILSRVLKETSDILEGRPGQASSAKAADGLIEGDASCPEGPGKLEYALGYFSYIDYTAKGVFIYNSYCSRGTRFTGMANADLYYDRGTLMLSAMTISFEGMTISSYDSDSGSTYFEADGTIRYYNITESSYNEKVNTVVRDRNAPRIYKTENLEMVNSIGAGYIDVSVNGGIFYHPEHGSVSMNTPVPLRYYDDTDVPSSGSFQITGGSDSKALLSFFASDLYKVQADLDGNGTYDIDSGVKNRDGTSFSYSRPTVNAGADQTVYVGQTVTLNGGNSASQYGEPLAYSWSITSKPSRSSTVLMNQNTVSPSFTPDIAGTYIISLQVSDGYSESLADQVTVTVLDLPLFSNFNAIHFGASPQAVAVADLNGDDRTDVALVTSISSGSSYENRLHVLPWISFGGLESILNPASFDRRPSSIMAGDVNDDGRADVVVGMDNGFTVFLQNNSGALVMSAFYLTNNTYKLALGDFNNDGRLDVAGVGVDQTVEVRLQDGSGGLSAPITYTVAGQGGYRMIAAGDVNGDGLTDIVVTYFGPAPTRGLAVFPQNNSRTFDSPVYHQMASSLYVPYGLAVGDVNGDMRQDIVFTYGGNADTAKLGVFLQNAHGDMGQQISYSAYDIPEPVAIADVNNDGRGDILVAHGGWNALTIYLQESNGQLGSYQKYDLPYASHYNPQGLAVGDVNNDGKKDVVIADYNNGLVVLYNIY